MSTIRKRNVASADSKNSSSKGNHSPDSSSTETTEPALMVEYPPETPPKKSSAVAASAKVAVIPNKKCCWLDRFLQGYTSFMTQSVNQDRGIKLLQWTLWLFSHLTHDRTNTAVKTSCRKLFNEFSFARYVLRLLGLPPALEATRSGSWGVTSSPKPIRDSTNFSVKSWPGP
jgi:hypothetical protein